MQEQDKMDIDPPDPETNDISFLDLIMRDLDPDDYECHIRPCKRTNATVFSVIHKRSWTGFQQKESDLEFYMDQPDAIFTYFDGFVAYRRICTNPRKLFYDTGPGVILEILVPADTIIPPDWELLNPPNTNTISYYFGDKQIYFNYGNDYKIIQARRKDINNTKNAKS